MARLLSRVFDPKDHLTRYPDVLASGMAPLDHYMHWGAAENRDPNPWFDSAWYLHRYPDVAASGARALLHYLQVGIAKGYDPHPKFNSAWYIGQHPEAASNPLFYHLLVGKEQGWITRAPICIKEYLPVSATPPLVELAPTAVIVPVYLVDLNRPSAALILLSLIRCNQQLRLLSSMMHHLR